MNFDREMLNEHAMDFADEPLYHKGCGGIVKVKDYHARYDSYGWSPPEQVVTCGKCGEIGYDETTDSFEEGEE